MSIKWRQFCLGLNVLKYREISPGSVAYKYILRMWFSFYSSFVDLSNIVRRIKWEANKDNSGCFYT